MGIKCSLLGHQFSGTAVREKREEQGSEVIITIEEVETCDRCGTERVVSENKEVTAVETARADAPETGAEDAEAGADVEAASGPSPSTGTSPAPDMDAVEDDAEIIGGAADGATSTTVETAEPAGADTAASSEPAPSPEADDAVILDDDDDEPEREPGEWPDDAEEATDEEPAADAADAGEETAAATGTPGEEWPEEADSGPTESDPTAPDVSWPEEGEDGDEDDWKPSESLTQQIDRTEVEPAGSATVTVPEGEFECPECGFNTTVESTSLRAGDFCPECHRGSLEHVPEDETRKE
jgi:transcription elongation factor Elf1